MSSAIVLLPALRDLRGDLSVAPRLARALGRAEALAAQADGRDAQIHRHFKVLPKRLSAAPLSRLLDADDAAHNGWLRCDPAHVRADGPLLRMMAYGEALQPEPDEVEALLRDLRPLFGDLGAPIDAPHPARWYAAIELPDALPAMVAPEQALGEDLLEHLPAGRPGLRWRQLWNESQVVLHNHPINEARIKAGKLSINSLWFWGGGRLPDSVGCDLAAVRSDAPLVRALSRIADRASFDPADPSWPDPCLLDLPRLRDIDEIERDVLPELQQRLARGTLQRATLDFADGLSFVLEHRQRWRWWRRSLRQWPQAATK